MRNPMLFKALRVYASRAVSILEEGMNTLPTPPMTTRARYEATGPGTSCVSYEPCIHWMLVLFMREESLKRLPEYQAASGAMNADPQVNRHLGTLVGTTEFRTRMDVESCLLSLLLRLVLHQDGLRFNDASFDRIYGGFEDFFYSDSIRLRYVALLNNLRTEPERIELGDCLALVKISKEEKEEVLSEHFSTESYRLDVMQCDYALEVILDTPKMIGEGPAPDGVQQPSQLARAKLDAVCSALRLFRSGMIGYNHILVTSTPSDPHGGRTIFGPLTSRQLLGTPYSLLGADVPAFVLFWKEFDTFPQDQRPRLRLALRRFNFGSERERPEDKLIDYMIAFESLLLRKSEKDELAYRLSLRGSLILGHNSAEREAAYAFLRTAYRIRSDIVHGEDPKQTIRVGNDELVLSLFVGSVEEHLRKILGKFLLQCRSTHETSVIDQLDRAIISGINPGLTG